MHKDVVLSLEYDHEVESTRNHLCSDFAANSAKYRTDCSIPLLYSSKPRERFNLTQSLPAVTGGIRPYHILLKISFKKNPVISEMLISYWVTHGRYACSFLQRMISWFFFLRCINGLIHKIPLWIIRRIETVSN